MRKSLFLIFLYLVIPTLCQGNTGREPRLEFPQKEASVYGPHRLVLEHEWPVRRIRLSSFPAGIEPGGATGISLRDINEEAPVSGKPAPEDMVSMVSFVWGELFGGVDIVAEVREFARKIRHKGQSMTEPSTGRHGVAGRWKFIIAWRIKDMTEVAAQFNDRG